jgi:SAM-dependent methyltransferase
MAVAENVIRLLGRYSEGLRLAAEHGPHSGVVQEYAYQNTPHGSGPLGWLIDRTFLQLGTWDALRQRAQATKSVVEGVLARRRVLGMQTMILDVASGTAPYLRELARDQGGEDLVIVCHDRDPRQVTHGRQLIASENLPRFTFSVGDATDDASYLSSRDPDIILAIGLFSWFQNDEAVRATLRLAFSHLAPLGCIVCSTLSRPRPGIAPWNSDPFGFPLAVRHPETIKAWLQAAGFVDIHTWPIDGEESAIGGWKPMEAAVDRAAGQADGAAAAVTNSRPDPPFTVLSPTTTFPAA